MATPPPPQQATALIRTAMDLLQRHPQDDPNILLIKSCLEDIEEGLVHGKEKKLGLKGAIGHELLEVLGTVEDGNGLIGLLNTSSFGVSGTVAVGAGAVVGALTGGLGIIVGAALGYTYNSFRRKHTIEEYILQLEKVVTTVYESVWLTNTTLRKLVAYWCQDRDRAERIFGNISIWDTSKVTDMSNLFENKKTFNDNINGWNVSLVTNMSYMFCRCENFNQPLDSWNVGNVVNMQGMFQDACNFNQPLSSWQVGSHGKTVNIDRMFERATAFNQSLDTWSVKVGVK